jgi:acetyl/propionyl-CoA carboxylase alpha subunit
LYAESPARNFVPQPGRVDRLHFPQLSGLRVDCGIELGTQVSPYYDPLLAKVIGWGPTRSDATEKLHQALSETEILLVGKTGPRDNNVTLLRQLLKSPEWTAADYDTRTVERLLTATVARDATQQLAAKTPIGGN